MINKIAVSSLLFFLLIALSIKLIDSSITYVNIGEPFLTYMRNCSFELNSFKIEIPNIPKIDVYFQEVNTNLAWYKLVLNVLINIGMAFFSFINVLSTILNVLINIINVLISLIQFIIIMIKNLKSLRDSLVSNSTSEPYIDYLSSSSIA